MGKQVVLFLTVVTLVFLIATAPSTSFVEASDDETSSGSTFDDVTGDAKAASGSGSMAPTPMGSG